MNDGGKIKISVYIAGDVKELKDFISSFRIEIISFYAEYMYLTQTNGYRNYCNSK